MIASRRCELGIELGGRPALPPVAAGVTAPATGGVLAPGVTAGEVGGSAPRERREAELGPVERLRRVLT